MNKLIRQLIQPTEDLLNLQFRYEQKCEVFKKHRRTFKRFRLAALSGNS